RTLYCGLLHMCRSGSYLKSGFGFLGGNEKALLIQLCKRLACFYSVIEVDEYLRYPAGKLRTHIDRNFGVDATGRFHQSRNCAALYGCSKEGGSFAIPIVGVTKPRTHRADQKRCNC